MLSVSTLTYGDVKDAADRIRQVVRPVTMIPVDPGTFGRAQVWLAAEFMQHTGTFKARGAANFVAAHREAGTMPRAGIVIASGGNAGLACAWAAGRYNIPATVFVPHTAPMVKITKLRATGPRYARSAVSTPRRWRPPTDTPPNPEPWYPTPTTIH